jgi:hypothetical protein
MQSLEFRGSTDDSKYIPTEFLVEIESEDEHADSSDAYEDWDRNQEALDKVEEGVFADA